MHRPAPVLEVVMPPWLYAKTHHVLGVTGLIIYRSAGIRDTDTPYEGVKKVLDEHKWTVMHTVNVETKDMMDGWAELAIYALTTELSEMTCKLLLVNDWLDQMRAECRRFLEL
jgi:hypothetical protein